MKTTLLAVTGLSPAIVTETLWALAKQKPAILPERVVFITTSTGVAKIEEQLFSPVDAWGSITVWDALRKQLMAGPDQIIADPPAVISIPDAKTSRHRLLDDIRSREENAAAAEFIFGQVWNVVRDKDQRLIASIAGGRKTMGALLHSAVSLIGRESDLLTHILVDPPFDTLPGFFFPGQPGGDVVDRAGKLHKSRNANPIVAEVPFVPLRNRFKVLDDLPGSFLNLRDKLAETLTKDAKRQVSIRLDHRNSLLVVDGEPYENIRARALVVLHFILQTNLDDDIPQDQPAAAARLRKWYPEMKKSLGFGHIETPNFDDSDIRRELNHLREILKSAAWQPALRTLRQSPFRMEE